VSAEATRQRFDRHSRIRDVLSLGERGRKLLYEHGFDPGEGFADVLSRYQSLEAAARSGRLRDLPELLRKLNGE
jgi:hypothetical protein